MRALALILFLCAVPFFAATDALADTETDFVVTVKARDAKFIGSSAGGAQITIRDRNTGDIIASGITYGGTGDTASIMADSRARDAVLVNEDTAKMQFSLELWEPTPVTITATAPFGQPQSLVSVSEDTVLIPGMDYTSGNGIMLELPGFAVDLLSPVPNQTMPFDPEVPFEIRANVMKLCGCKIADGTPWPPERYKVEARIYKDDLFITSIEMPYAGQPGIYGTNLKVPLSGSYRILVTAFDPATKEAGMDTTTIVMEEQKKEEKTK